MIDTQNRHCLDCHVRACSVLHGCSPYVLGQFSSAKKGLLYRKGQRLLVEGMASDGVYFIHSGRVKICKSGSNGKQLILRFATMGEALGYSPGGDAVSHSASAITLEDTRVCFVDKKSFREFMKACPAIALQLVAYYHGLLKQAESRSLSMARMNVPSKVAKALCEIFDAYATPQISNGLDLPLSRQDIADLAGTTKEQVSKILGEFSDMGWIRTSGKHIDVLRYDRLFDCGERNVIRR